jgi:hypothetical protein
MAVALAACCIVQESFSQNFYPLKEHGCLTQVAPLFTTGGQYVEGYPNNGVIPDSFSLLTRWQGQINQVDYQLGNWTGLNVPALFGNYQRGWDDPYSPEDPTGTPGSQLYCNEGGMLVNTWPIRHQTVKGGGYNNMFGYSWSSSTAPWAFKRPDGTPSDLVIQIDAAIPWVSGRHIGISTKPRQAPTLDTALFAYLRDTTRPDLPDIAIIASVATAPRVALSGHPPVEQLYVDRYVTGGFVSFDYYPGGVWFASGAIRTSSPYMTVNYTNGRATMYDTIYNPSAPPQFYRVHLSPRNLREIVLQINNNPCSACPPKGYSTDPGNYKVVYSGLIHEIFTFDDSADPPGPFTPNNTNYDQMSASVKFRDLGIFHHVSNSSLKTGIVILTNNYYTAIMHRAPEEQGRDYWVSTVTPFASAPDVVQKFREMAWFFFHSQEYTNPAPPLAPPSNSQFVDDLYQITLGRAPDEGGRVFWISQLDSGAWNRDQVLSYFLYSTEYYLRTATVVFG